MLTKGGLTARFKGVTGIEIAISFITNAAFCGLSLAQEGEII
jgi:hypothetical protein